MIQATLIQSIVSMPKPRNQASYKTQFSSACHPSLFSPPSSRYFFPFCKLFFLASSLCLHFLEGESAPWRNHHLHGGFGNPLYFYYSFFSLLFSVSPLPHNMVMCLTSHQWFLISWWKRCLNCQENGLWLTLAFANMSCNSEDCIWSRW